MGFVSDGAVNSTRTARARACGGLRERGQGGRGGGVVSSLFLFARPVQLWRASCGHPNHGAISQMVKINGRQSASAEFHMSSERHEIACEGAAWTGETFERTDVPLACGLLLCSFQT